MNTWSPTVQGFLKSPHDSGQPLPPGYDPYDPYAAYTAGYVYDYLSSYCTLLFEPGTSYAYSNTGMGLVGHVLGLIDSSSYDVVMRREMIEILGMDETSLYLCDDREGSYNLSIGMAWHIDVLPEGYTFYWHGGRTNGYMTYMAFDMEVLSGVVILCNQSQAGVITRFGEDVLKAVNKFKFS